MKLPKELTTVTPLSKYLALILFVILPVLSFYLGINYSFNKIGDSLVITRVPSNLISENSSNSSVKINPNFGIYDPDLERLSSGPTEVLNYTNNYKESIYKVINYEECPLGFCIEDTYEIKFPDLIDAALFLENGENTKFVGSSIVMQKDNIALIATRSDFYYENLDKFLLDNLLITRIDIRKAGDGRLITTEEHGSLKLGPIGFVRKKGGYGVSNTEVFPICYDTNSKELYLKYRVVPNWDGEERVFKITLKAEGSLESESQDNKTFGLLNPKIAGTEVGYDAVSCLNKILDINEYSTYLESSTNN